MELTTQGAALFARATVILREVEQARAEIKVDGKHLTGEVSFGLPPTVADLLSGPLIETFSRLHPQVRLRVSSGYSGHVLEWLQRGIIDLGILYEIKHPPMIRSRPLLVERLFLVEKGRPGAAGSDLAFSDVLVRRLILPSKQHGLRVLLDEIAAQGSHSIGPVAEVDSLPAQIDLVRRGMGSTILPLLPVASDVEKGVLSVRPIILPEIKRRLILANTLDRPMSAATRLFADTVVEEVSKLVRHGLWKGVLPENDIARDMP